MPSPVHRSLSRTYYGIVLGTYSVLTVISLQAAIFWGQYANCDAGHYSAGSGSGRLLEGVSCERTGAMKALCTFAVFLFVSHVAFGFLLFVLKDKILGKPILLQPTQFSAIRCL